MLTARRVVNTPFIPSNHHLAFVVMVRTLNHYSHSNFQMYSIVLAWGFCIGIESPYQRRRHWSLGFYPRVRKIPWRRKWQHTPVFLPGKSYGQRSLAGYSPWDCKESDTTEQLSPHQTSIVCICQSQSSHSSQSALSPWISIHLFSTSVFLFLPCK